jgi:PAS domain S-box-containing protein
VQKAIEEEPAVVPTAYGSLLNRGGEEYLVEYSAAPIHSRDGRVSAAIVVFRNITVRQRTETVHREAHH